ncbi:polynucleotide adenylyltransferase PcnB [Corticibacter populi]|uniref:Poly(A) polymerase I n=1 Tax=Corticibacter populi TaxID=1550736 RepID=A0A3M6QM29_9BURK|nr:polynucleotide adenylyltransferase PcnB [Corticibacter populi]RMX03472.1 polynucleotide adenylyltransferase PcnB [Corticibacter populi]RZS29911.1 poly(A) polymerase [Corticibacter populi]
MIKQFIDKLLGKKARNNTDGGNRGNTHAEAERPARGARASRKIFGTRRDVGAEVHGIDPKLVDRRANEVVTTLQDHGYEAYIVGGAVRDLLLGLKPKDFDVATNATPEQVKALFRRAFIIGRRFRIVHVVFGRGRENEVIEVTTFRAYLDNQAADKVSGNEKTSRQALANVQHAVDASGRVLRDNVWGSQQEDAARRDFSINAMYYDPRTQTVVDYHKGIEDARRHTIRMIGEPATRYREDPVRMLRAIRFAAKLRALGFTLDAKTAQPLSELRGLLGDIPPSRMFDEMLKLLQTGHALASIAELRELHLESGIYPLLDLIVARGDQPLVQLALQDTDRRVAEGKSVAPSFLLACVLWDDVQRLWQQYQQDGLAPHPALHQAIDETFERRVGDVSGRGKLGADMREIWVMQPRFERRTGKAPLSLVEQPRFRAGFDFLRLRARTGELDEALAQWWETFSLASDEQRLQMLEEARRQSQQSCKLGTGGTGPKRKSRKPRTQDDATADTPAEAADVTEDAVDMADMADMADVATTPDDETAPPAAKKRRRRRRKPADAKPADGGLPGAAAPRAPDAQA